MHCDRGVVFVFSIKRIASAISELTDKTLPEDKQLLILKALTAYYDTYKGFISVNTRYSGGRAMIDLHIPFDDSTTYSDIRESLRKISGMIKQGIPDSVVTVSLSECNGQ